jgi:hypothetical protein
MSQPELRVTRRNRAEIGVKKIWRNVWASFKDAFEPALSGAWDGGAGTAARRSGGRDGLS